MQVEYAMEAINNAGTTVGLTCKDGVIIAGEKKISSKLLDMGKQSEKLFQINNQMFCGVAGITSDAMILVNKLRLSAQQHIYTYGQSMPVEQLVTSICDTKQGYTQYGGLRPFGVSFLIGGYDTHHGWQLYHTDPSGNYSGWKAYTIGQHKNTAHEILKKDWQPDLSMQQALELTAKVLIKTMDTPNPNAEKLEISVVEKVGSEVKYRRLTDAEVNKLMADATPKAEEEEKA